MCQGSEEAFASVWDRHYAGVVRRLLVLGATVVDAEEIAATTFLVAWRRRRHVHFVDGSLFPWLLVTAHNVERNNVRAQRRYAKVFAKLPAPEDAPDPADIFERESLAPETVRALARPSPSELSLLVLIGLEGMRVKEAADVIGLRESAARMRLARLRAKLRTAPEFAGRLEGGEA